MGIGPMTVNSSPQEARSRRSFGDDFVQKLLLRSRASPRSDGQNSHDHDFATFWQCQEIAGFYFDAGFLDAMAVAADEAAIGRRLRQDPRAIKPGVPKPFVDPHHRVNPPRLA